MIKYTIRRFLQSVPTLFGITLLSYLIMTAAPGGPVSALAFDPDASPEERAALEARLGVNDPWIIQYTRWLLGDDWMRVDTDGDGTADRAILIPLDADGDGVPEPPGDRQGILRGDFGQSLFSRQPVINMITSRVPATLELGLTALLIGLLVGVPIGIIAGVQRGGIFDNFTRIVAVMFSALPIFWLGLIVVLIGTRGGIPELTGGQCAVSIGGCPPLHARLAYLLPPAFVLATPAIAGYSRYMRTSMLEVISQDYVRTAQAKGLPGMVVWFQHAARNALIPLATFLGPALTTLLGGAVVTERIFSWPGIGRMSFNAVIQQDYPVVMAVVIVSSLATILGYFLSDVLYAIIDPRIRFN